MGVIKIDVNNEKIWFTNLPKLIISALSIVCATVLMAMHAVDPALGMSIISGNSVYIMTNGTKAFRGKNSQE